MGILKIYLEKTNYIFKMNSDQESKCNQCLNVFDVDRTPFKMPTCSHNICSKCLEEIRADKLNVIHCEFCHNSLNDCLKRRLQPNVPLRKRIAASIIKSPKKSDQVDKSNSSFKILPGSHNDDDGEILLTEEDAGDGAANSKLSNTADISKQMIGMDLCNSHHKPLDIICVTDSKVVCSHCGLFG